MFNFTDITKASKLLEPIPNKKHIRYITSGYLVSSPKLLPTKPVKCHELSGTHSASEFFFLVSKSLARNQLVCTKLATFWQYYI